MKNFICEHSYSPKCDKVKSGVLVSGCIAAAIGMLAVSEIGGILAPYFKAGASVWLVLGALFAVRLLGTGYIYSILRDPDSSEIDLAINELHLGKSKTVCRVSLFDVKELLVYDPFSKDLPAHKSKCRAGRRSRPRPNRKKYGDAKLYNYCVDVFPTKYCLIRISEGRGAYVRFMPDDFIVEVIKNHIVK